MKKDKKKKFQKNKNKDIEEVVMEYTEKEEKNLLQKINKKREEFKNELKKQKNENDIIDTDNKDDIDNYSSDTKDKRVENFYKRRELEKIYKSRQDAYLKVVHKLQEQEEIEHE